MNAKHINLSRINKILLLVFLVGLLLYLAKSFLIPLAIAAFFAMLLYPVVQKLQLYGLKKPLAATVAIVLLLVTVTLVSTIIYYTLSDLQKDLPELEVKIKEKTNRLQWLLSRTTDISENEQEAIIK